MSDENPIEKAVDHLKGGALKKKLGPLPVWAWGLIGGTAAVIGIIIYRKRAATAAATASTGTTATTDPNAAANAADSAAVGAAGYQSGLTDGTGLLGSDFTAQPAPISAGGGTDNSVVPTTGGFSGMLSGSRSVSTGLAASAVALPALPSLTLKTAAPATKSVSTPSVGLTYGVKTPSSQAKAAVVQKQLFGLIVAAPAIGIPVAAATGLALQVKQTQDFVGTVGNAIASVFAPKKSTVKYVAKPAPKLTTPVADPKKAIANGAPIGKTSQKRAV